jgi:proline iminopeptidase
MKTAYPPVKPFKTHTLEVDAPHKLYVEEVGNPEGLPVIFVHGGPGTGCAEADRCFFDPKVYRVIIFDQRGCGRSSPLAEIKNNTTPDLVSDIEKIRKLLDIDKWVVFGGSWGSTLGLIYAQTFPDRVMGLVLRGIFLAREEDTTWLYGGGAGAIFPEYWQEFVSYIPEPERHNLTEAYYKRLTDPDPDVQMRAAQTWIMWEGRCASCSTIQSLHCVLRVYLAIIF